MEIPAERTPGIAAILSRSWAKKRARSAQVVCAFSPMGMIDGHRVLRFIAERNVCSCEQSLNGRTGCGHQQQSERDLARDKRRCAGGCLSRCPSAAVCPACITWLISGRADCSAGKRPKTIPLSNARPTLKNRTAQIDVEVGFVGIGVLRKRGNNEPNRLIGNKDPQSRSGTRQEQRFG